ncbi:uncharacterized protein LOC129581457 [Paramacrobiotus metropolitanus]|uniref:uncharacterized protein LOC129581457 n=1 Tax=Paramacrobiotus metropolitanus TaxID=2943436 RepID=UPI002445BDEB|nr:uncharacterized protein LOC129581457 [Paramacrobiotus metropolitanus]
MRYLAAYLLCTLGGKTNPTAEDIEKVLSSVGIDADKQRIKLVLEKLKGKNVEEVIAQGSKKLAALPAAGPAAPAAGATPTVVKDDKPAAKEEAKKEEKKGKDKEEEEDDDMGFGLFD